MFKRKANLCIILLITMTACTKQDITQINESAHAGDESEFRWWPFPNTKPYKETIFGLVQELNANKSAEEIINENKDRMKKAGINLTRVSIALSVNTSNSVIDDYLNDGYNVQIIANWNGGANGFRGFPTSAEISLLKSQAEAFFQYYEPYKSQIPFVAIENEWDWEVVHGSVLQDYLTELKVITDIGHKYGFKIADGGVTTTALQRWTYSQLSGEEQEQWGESYWIGVNYVKYGDEFVNGGYSYYDHVDMVNAFAAGAKDIDYDYSNVHWANSTTCSNGFGTASQRFMLACNKELVVCNEFYIKTNTFNLFDLTVDELKGDAEYALAYSGPIEGTNAAIYLTDAMIKEL
jgi:hypothetical protein